ncbi:MAG: hypothetical protein J7L63_04995 [Thermoplasmata archaeon]|nr:hypothetical protein [Thermoplasmata archaeon]
MDYEVLKFPDNFDVGGYANFGYSMYLRNCGFALRAVPLDTVSPNLNHQITTRLFNSLRKDGKEALRNKTATPSATLCSHFATLRSGRNTSAKRPSKLPYRVTSLSRGTLGVIGQCGLKQQVDIWLRAFSTPPKSFTIAQYKLFSKNRHDFHFHF